MIGGVSLQGFIASLTFQGGTDAIAFQTYVTEVLVPNLWEGACVVMDNFSSHKVEGIQEDIEAVGAKLVYLPPYSPDFNPIGNCWSKVKEFLRAKAARTYETLDQAITEAINNPAASYGVLEIAGSDSLPFMISGRIGPKCIRRDSTEITFSYKCYLRLLPRGTVPKRRDLSRPHRTKTSDNRSQRTDDGVPIP